MGVLADVLRHPDELSALLQVAHASHVATRLPRDLHLAFCYDMLNKVSRSFAIVIQQLGPQLRDPVCVFYLVLRALDTIEDDMSVELSLKLELLENFHKHIHDPSWKFVCGEKHYRRLMENFHQVSRVFLQMGTQYQDVIRDTTKQMGQGMAKFVQQEVRTVAEYDEYCFYVAGLTGYGLSDLFHASNLEKNMPRHLANSMGLFLQKTNIIRDYLEDIEEEPAPRMFWPREIWGKHAENLEDFRRPERGSDAEKHAVECLNEMVTDALRHACDCIMAMGTLSLCYGNPGVFHKVVKMRRGLTAKVMVGTKSICDVYSSFNEFGAALAAKVSAGDPMVSVTLERVSKIRHLCIRGGYSKNALNVRDNSEIAQAISWVVLILAVLLGMFLLLLQPHPPLEIPMQQQQ
eukprot:TRINITY_DN13246_c0_g1_i5.p1 TRINITY_DN13246_c0_g1~~TRINITY_DN13246_c0_g1_i5.p1  ORF type:complete len:405 (+),score=80.85 TRINITY_DN13246_c0_g1_i5:168-1382(+)